MGEMKGGLTRGLIFSKFLYTNYLEDQTGGIIDFYTNLSKSLTLFSWMVLYNVVPLPAENKS
jgi:hypothetical protein